MDFLIKIIFILCTVQITCFYYIAEGYLPRVFLYIIYLSQFLLPAILILKFRIKINLYRFYFLLLFSLMVLVSFFYLDDDLGEVIYCFALFFQLISAYVFTRFDISYLENIFKLIAIVALLALLYILTYTSLDFYTILSRRYTWQEIFYFAPLFWAVIPFTIISFLLNRNIALCLLYWGGALVLNLLFLKRFILVDSILLIFIIPLIIFFKTRKLFYSFMFIVLLSLLIAVILYFKGDLIAPMFEATKYRMETSAENISESDRLIESENYLKEASIENIILGTGFASTHTGLGEKAFALHIGWINFIFKGGLLFLILLLIPYFKILIITLNMNMNKLPLKVQFSIWYLIITFFRLLYTNMHGMYPEMLILFYAIFNIMDYSPSKI